MGTDMKILDLCEFYSERGGGVRSYLTKLTAGAGPRGHEVVVVAPGPRDETVESDGARVVRYAAPRMPYDPTYHWPWRVDRMHAIVREERPDVLQVSSPFVPAVVATTLRDVPVRSYVYHSDPIGCYLEYNARRYLPRGIAEVAVAPAWAWMRTICRSCDVTIVAGHWLEDFLKKRGCERVTTVPFGISHSEFGPERRDEALRRELMGTLADDPDAKLLLITGRLAVDKRQRLLLAAVKQLARKRPLALVVLGDGPERERMEREAQGMPAATFLSFTRDRAHYAAVLASVDALIHGSRCETYGFVLAETLASGTPMVVPDAGGATAMAPDECAETYDPLANEKEIAASIDRLLARPQAELSRAAVATAAEHPTMEDHFDELFNLYERLVERRRP
jgi:alpha-1,6-mannosyltransferase